ncbi:transcriptional corepressor of histone-like protein genes [Aaosphaeria arxii CBS 175.79]|uniref:Histone transcription regulator 3 homolog n=1 Tax=Aaosphaeria arxii CBS 175.79 TaxID=1450172 RepID=A0A6A5XSI0_9PLEO|nr:transcriptional corepressor of histone-like protein genes [Aaosphaeria arxii CBS 175.79]KAF2016295.1 transcriptional corepressor of histone-like protein genes [Aaosphaeria arxii CBS 175.79]
MSAFKALNLDSENESEDEVDNTKEIQTEEALKLYVTALKYQSEGPESFDKAAAAYKELFESEVFKYTESLSEWKRHELFGDSLVFDSILEDEFEAGPVQLTGANESAPNTLPQILHLSYKNHGQFMLQTMQHYLQEHGTVPQDQGSTHVLSALQQFAEALDKEDTDLDLWLRTASVAALLGSHRITRFCLEAVLDGDDELLDSILRLPGLEEGFAGQQLRELVAKLEDSLSLQQAPLSYMPRKKLSELIKKRLNPYPFAPLPSEVSKTNPSNATEREPERILLAPAKWDWAGLGEAILHHFLADQGGYIEPVAGACINIDIPSDVSVDDPSGDEPTLDDPSAETIEEQAEPSKEEQAVATTNEQGDVSTGNNVKEIDAKEDEEQGGAATPPGPTPASRKRSTDSAGFPEAEGGRGRSKRLRARDSFAAEGSAGAEPGPLDAAKQLEDKLYAFIHADKCLYEIVNDIFERLDVESLGSPEELRVLLSNPQSETSSVNGVDKAASDMYNALQSGDAKIAGVLLSSEPVDLGGMSREAGLNAFLGYAKSSNSRACSKPILGRERLGAFSRNVNDTWLSIKEVALTWLENLLAPNALLNTPCLGPESKSGYMDYRWAEDLKRHLVQIIVNFDDYIYEYFLARLEQINAEVLVRSVDAQKRLPTGELLSTNESAQIEVIETIFELHLDIYSLIRHPHSGVDVVTQTVQKHRLHRWCALARDAMHLRSSCMPTDEMDELALRHVWAFVFQMSVNDDISPELVIHAMGELKGIFESRDGLVIEVQNNAVMPELSVAAIDRELARISMKDFFLRVFDQDEKDPVTVIESLEPILEPAEEPLEEPENDQHPNEQTESEVISDTAAVQADVNMQSPPTPIVESSVARSPSQEMKKFLDTASISLRLSLWQRLREAYEAIEYPPKVMSCYLRSIEILIAEFKSPAHLDSPDSDRYVKVLSRLRIIDEVLAKILHIIKDDSTTAFDCLTYKHLQTSITTISELLRILHAGNFLEDLVRVGNCSLPRFEGYPQATFLTITARLHDMQLRAWMLQYFLLREGTLQNPSAFPTPSEDKFEFLRHVHHATGVRSFCHASGRLFLRLAKDEILAMDDVIDGNTRDTELAQVLHDLYGLKIFIQPGDCHEYNSVPEVLERKMASQLLSFVLSQANKINIKDLPKTDLKTTIDKVHGALGRLKPNEDIVLNRKVLTTYLKSPINPVALFNCIKGIGSLSTRFIPDSVAVTASKGWYYLMGNIALSKFRSQKRLTQGPTEDLNFAQAFFLQDLEYSVDRWETWYRLAQANDAQLEECVSWTAEKMNSNSVELIHFQRAAIHCYVMATACAVRDADVAPQTLAKVAELYTDFGNRIYSSSREPFNMSAFKIRDTEKKYYSGRESHVVYQHEPFVALSEYTAWKFASVLYKRAINGNPDKWWNHYMLAKCLWKMYTHNTKAAAQAAQDGQVFTSPSGPTWEQAVEALVNAIESLPEKRERGREPILEPHYKLASIAHKLFQRKVIDHEKACEIIKNTHYVQNIGGPENADDWERYILAVIKALRTADKSAWHHRMIARAAHIIYDDSTEAMVAYGAKHELTQQMFTKTMTVQVWKPEHERPGRHFVYTTRYTHFFIELLTKTTDKANFEALAKRVRRKHTDFFEHSKLWQELCSQYLKLLRNVLGKIPNGHEDAVFKSVNYEEFSIMAARLEAWCQDNNTQHPVLDTLRDAIELKRLNNGLMKSTAIDDLIGDTYAMLYSQIGPTLSALPQEQQGQQQSSASGQQTNAPTDTTTDTSSAQAPPQLDGSTESANLPFSIYHPNQLSQPPSADNTARPRAKAVGRREVQRRAEGASAKPSATVPATTHATMTIRSPSAHVHPQVVIPVRASPAKHEANSQSPIKSNAQLQIPASGSVTAPGSVANADSSAPPSVHDDADDESELSELDDSEVREMEETVDVNDSLLEGEVSSNPMFPYLNSRKTVDDADDSDNAVDDTSEAQYETAEEVVEDI